MKPSCCPLFKREKMTKLTDLGIPKKTGQPWSNWCCRFLVCFNHIRHKKKLYVCYSLYCSHLYLVWTLASPACHCKAPTAWRAWARFVNPTLNTLTSLARRKTQQWTNMSRRSPVVSLLFRLFSVTLSESTKPATCNLQSAILQFCICRSFEKQVLGNCIHFPFFQRVKSYMQYPLQRELKNKLAIFFLYIILKNQK